MSAAPSTRDHIETFRRAMAEAGIAYSGPIEGDGKRRRIYVEGDRKDRKNGWYLFWNDERPVGVFGSWKGGKFTWKADSASCKPLSREERDEIRRRQEEARARKVAEETELQARAAARSQSMWDAAVECATHPYLTRKGVGAYGVRIGEFWKERKEDNKPFLVAKDALLIRMRDGSGTTGLQAIYAQPLKIGDEARDKDFVYGAKKAGCWATIGQPTELNGRRTLLIGEGYATCSTAHEATGLGVIIAFDAGNLLAVAREVRRLMPDARLVFIADDDQWTERPVKNPGLTKARDAAATVSGEVVSPTFADVSEKPTDWNDLHVQAGLEEVRRQLMAVLDPQPEALPEPDLGPEEPPPIESVDDFGPIERDPAPESAAPPAPSEDPEGEEIENPYFTVRGHDRTQIFVYQHEMKMVVPHGRSRWSDDDLTSIAPLHWWELNFPGDKGMNRKQAVNWLQRMAYKRGFFDPDSLRGRGAWRDDGRFVFHFGHKLSVDGQMMDVTKIDSEFIYEQGRRLRLPAHEPLSNADGRRVFEAFQLFRWTRPASALLLAGWTVLAPVAGALGWRPHVWITGGAGSGKTSCLNFVDRLMNGVRIYAQGNSTEAGIRQTLRTDAIPVLFDESEQNNEREAARMESVLALVRQSSTESDAQTLKGTQGGDAMHFLIRSMFCLGSIQVGLKQQADIERFAVLNLKSKRQDAESPEAKAESAKFSAIMADFKSDSELPGRLLRRTLDLLPTTIENIGVFTQAAAEKFGSQREGDQYGALLAGAWSLVSTKLATLDDARAMISRYVWDEYREGSETDASEKTLSALLGLHIRVGNSQDISIEEVVLRAAGVDCEVVSFSRREAAGALKRYGYSIEWEQTNRIEDAALAIADRHGERDRLLGGTPHTVDIKGQLRRLPIATRTKQAIYFYGGNSMATLIPLAHVVNNSRSAAPGAHDVDDDNFDNIPF